MVSPDNKRKGHALQPMPPLLQCELGGQELAVADIIIPLRRGQPAGEKGTGVELVVGGRVLGEDRAHSSVRSVGLHHELKCGIGLDEDGSGNEASLETPECGLRLGRL